MGAIDELQQVAQAPLIPDGDLLPVGVSPEDLIAARRRTKRAAKRATATPSEERSPVETSRGSVIIRDAEGMRRELAELRELLRVDPAAVAKRTTLLLAEAQVGIRRSNQMRRDALLELLNEGWTQQELGDLTGITGARVGQLLATNRAEAR